MITTIPCESCAGFGQIRGLDPSNTTTWRPCPACMGSGEAPEDFWTALALRATKAAWQLGHDADAWAVRQRAQVRADAQRLHAWIDDTMLRVECGIDIRDPHLAELTYQLKRARRLYVTAALDNAAFMKAMATLKIQLEEV